jgi:hypothetical protein
MIGTTYTQKEGDQLRDEANHLMISLHVSLKMKLGEPDKEISFIINSDIEEMMEILRDMKTITELSFMR